MFNNLSQSGLLSGPGKKNYLQSLLTKILTILGSIFLIFVITFSLYTVIRKNQLVQIQVVAGPVIEKAVKIISEKWSYLEIKSLLSQSLIKQVNQSSDILKKFSQLGKLISQGEPVYLEIDPAPQFSTLAVTVSYKVVALFENGQAVFLFNLVDENDVPVITYANIDAVYNINTRPILPAE